MPTVRIVRYKPQDEAITRRTCKKVALPVPYRRRRYCLQEELFVTLSKSETYKKVVQGQPQSMIPGTRTVRYR